MDFPNFDIVYVFKVEESIADICTEQPCLRDLENSSQLPVREVLMILSYEFSKNQVDFRFKTYSGVLVNVSYRFLKFLDYSGFWGRGIHCWYFHRATMFGWPQKAR